MDGCINGGLADGTVSREEATQFCGCTLRGFQASQLSDDQLLQMSDAIFDPSAPVPDSVVQDAFGEVVFGCILSGGTAF